MEKEKLKKESNDSTLIVISFISVGFIVGILYLTYYRLNNLDPSDRGTFGDMFGAANALFSGLAFTGIIITILLQRKELALQRQELRDTREELKRSAAAQENSEKALTRQAENLKISAKLTALNSLVVHYSDIETRIVKGYQSKINAGEAIGKRDRYVQRIEEILERKDNR